MSSQHTWKKKTTFNELVDQLINDGGCGESTLPVTNRRGRLLVCPTRCSWSRRIRPGEDGRSWRKQQRWCHIWCCHESTPLIPDPHADQTACRWRHQSLWQRHCHSGSTKKKEMTKWKTVCVRTSSTERLLWRLGYTDVLHRWHWCQTRGQWRSVRTCPPSHPRVWQKHHKHQRQITGSRGPMTGSWRPLCVQQMWSSAGQSQCPKVHWNKDMILTAVSFYFPLQLNLWFTVFKAKVRNQKFSPSGISRACNNLVVIQESTAGQVSWCYRVNERMLTASCRLTYLKLFVSSLLV